MEKHWNLTPLYKDFGDPLIKEDLSDLAKKMDESIMDFKNLDPSNIIDASKALFQLLERQNHIEEKLDLLNNYASLTYSADTSHLQARKLMETVEELSPKNTQIYTLLKEFLKSITSIDLLIENEKGLKTYDFLLQEQKDMTEHALSEAEELLFAEIKNTGSSAWNRLQDQIVSSLTGNYEGQEKPLTVLRSMAYDKDPSVRRKAYDAELAAYLKKENESAACLNAIKGEVILEAKKRNYNSPLEMTLQTARMDSKTLQAMISSIEEYLPYFRRYLKTKAHLLGYSNGKLPFYDLFAPVGDVDLTYSYEQAADFVVKQFSTFSERLGQFARHAFDADWIDPFPASGKVAGAFCSNIHAIKESRILSNFTGSFDDMVTLAHELGHGYHGDCLNDVKMLNSDYPMPLAETASIFCETIVFNAAIKDASDAEKLVILENNLMGATQVIVDIYSRYTFETILFEKRKQGSLSVQELKDTMIEAQKKAYGDALDENYMHPYMWMCKPHYYYASSNFYNFPYAFGQLFALGLYALYQEDPETFVPRYDDLLEATGHKNIHDVLAIMDIDSHSPAFFKKSLDVLKGIVENFSSLSK